MPTSSKKAAAAAADDASLLFGVNPRAAANADVAFRELDDTQERPPQRTQNRPPVAWIWLGIVLTVAVIAAVAYFVVNLEPGKAPVSSSVKVPSVSGQSYREARATLRERGLTPIGVQESSDKVARNMVIRSEPGTGTAVARKQEVRLIVSTGPEQVTVPDVKSQPQDAATKALEDAGFTVGAVTSDYSTSEPEGTVLSTDPDSGGALAKGTVIDLVVSNGKVQLPDVTQQPITTALARLAELGLTAQSTPSNACTGNTVTQQSVPASDVAQGSTVMLTYCAAPAQPYRQPSAPANGGDQNGGGDQGDGDQGDGGD